MKIFDIRSAYGNGVAVVTATVEPENGAPLGVWFRLSGVDKAPTAAAEALTVGLLASCMYTAEQLKVYGALSWTLARNLESAQDVLTAWYPRLNPVNVLANQFTRVWRGFNHSTATACCFSAGVHSWYSVLKHDRRLTHLLLVRGFDPRLDDDDAWRAESARIAAIADRLGKRLIVCETNLRDVADLRNRHAAAIRNVLWEECLHGSGLAAVGLLLQREIGELIVPAVHTYRRLAPWGSSPLLDPLWSNDRLTVTHDGCEASRLEKIRYIATSDPALETLHVCDRQTDNCGACDKCVATMISLREAGALERSATFARRVSLPRAEAVVAPIRARPQSGGGPVPHAIAVARYIARMTASDRPRDVAAGGPRLSRRVGR